MKINQLFSAYLCPQTQTNDIGPTTNDSVVSQLSQSRGLQSSLSKLLRNLPNKKLLMLMLA